MENLSPHIKNSLRYSIYDGIYYFLMVGMGESFFIPFALFLNANTLQIGLLGSLPLLIGSVAQLGSNRIAKIIRSRKKLVCLGAGGQGLVFIPILLLIWYPGDSVHLFLTLACVYSLAGLIIVPAWTSWMGDLVPENSRGIYFGRRNKITGLFSLVSLIVAGLVMTLFQKSPEFQYIGFALLFISAFIFRMLSVHYIKKKWEPAPVSHNHSDLGVRAVIKDPKFRDFRRLTLFIVAMNFAVFLSAPYFIPYMLNSLKMSYFHFTLTQGAIILSKYLTMPLWGKISDTYGNRKVMVICSLTMPIVPILWLFHDSVGYLILVQAYSGLVWAGFELASFNMVLDHTPAEARVAGISYLNALTGIGIFVGAILGAQIVNWGPFFEIPYLSVFLFSAVARYLVTGKLLMGLKEVRQVESISYRRLLFRPFSDLSVRGLYQAIPRFKFRDPQ